MLGTGGPGLRRTLGAGPWAVARPAGRTDPGKRSASPSGWRAAAGPLGAWLALVILAAAVLALATAAATPQLPDGSLQLRVIGASDRPADQALKLQVRDAVLAVLAPGLARAPTAAAARQYVLLRLDAVRRVASAVAGRSGESAAVTLGEAALPPRRIGLVAFPAGRAPALVVTLGAGLGHNWWTVLFPPLALVTMDGDLIVVGPGGASAPVRDLAPDQRQALLDWVSGRTGIATSGEVSPAGPDSAAGARVQVRFLVWDLAHGISWQGLRDALLALVQGGGFA